MAEEGVLLRSERVDMIMLGEMMTLLMELDDTTFVKSLDKGNWCTG